MNISRLILAILALGMLSSVAFGTQTTAESEISRGLALLDEGNVLSETNGPAALARYREAAAILESVRTKYELHNAQLNHAIGNAYLKSGELGHAILAYRRALALDPTNYQARETLEYARTLVDSQAPASHSRRMVEWLLSWRGYLPRSAIWFGATAIFLAGWMLITLRIWKPMRFIARTGTVMVSVSLFSLGLLGLDAWESQSQRVGVITELSVNARTGPSAQIFGEAFQAPLGAGTEFVMIDQRDGWIQIQLASNAMGWVPEESVGLVGTGI